MGLLALPADVQREIYSYLRKESILSVNAVCRLTHVLVSPRIRAISQPIFEKRYGAVAACEKEIPIYILAQRTATILDLPVQLGIEQAAHELLKKFKNLNRQQRTLLIIATHSKFEQKTSDKAQSIVAQVTQHPSTVQFDQKEVPHLKPRQTYSPGNNLSFWQRLTTKYQFFRTLLDETYIIRNVYKAKLEAMNDLNKQPFVNVQNFIDRHRRISNLEREITTLIFLASSKDANYNEFCKKLSYFEAIAFRICYYVRSRIWMSDFPKINFNSFFEITESCAEKTIKFTNTTLTFENKIIPIEIKLDLSLKKPGIIAFTFLKNDKIWGYFTINRVWKDGNNRDYTEASDPTVPIMGQLTQRRLRIEFRFNKKEKLFKQDPVTGDYPLLRLMTQFCVEIFQREPENELEIIPLFPHVALAGGFYTRTFNFNALHQETVEARAQGKLFPVYQKTYQGMGYHFFLTKSNASTSPTRFVQPDTEQPSTVHFTLNGPPTTWEALIQQNPLIPGSGPILPHHITRDLSAFEA